MPEYCLVKVSVFLRDPCRVSRAVNALLRAGVPVFRVAEGPLAGGFAAPLKAGKVDVAAVLRAAGVEFETSSGPLRAARLRYPKICIYSGLGTYIEGRVHAVTLRRLGFYRQIWIGDLDFYSGVLEKADVLVVPGGWGSRGPDYIPFAGEGHELVRRFVERGGGYLGTCAGSIYLGERIDAADLEPGLTLGLLQARVTACFRGRGLVKIRVVARHPLLAGFPREFPVYHSGGFVLEPKADGNAEVVAVFQSLYKYQAYPWASEEDLKPMLGRAPNIVVGRVGKGKVVALSSHPEYQAHLRPGKLVFTTGGKGFEVSEEETVFGYALEAASVFYLASGKVDEVDPGEAEPEGGVNVEPLRRLAVKATPLVASWPSIREAVVALREAVRPLDKYGYRPPYIDDISMTFTLQDPPQWYKERYH